MTFDIDFSPGAAGGERKRLTRWLTRGGKHPRLMATDALQFIQQSLPSEGDLPPETDMLLAVSRLKVASLAMGEEQTRNGLLPYLLELVDVRASALWPEL